MTTTARVDYAPGFSPWNIFAPLNPGDWDVLGPVLSWSHSRGRTDAIDAMEPGTASFEIDDANGAVWAASLAGDIEPLTLVRLVVTHNATDYVRFVGFLVDAPQPEGRMEARRVRVRAQDWLGWASQVPLPGSKWASMVAESEPLLWWSTDATGTVPLRATYNERVINKGRTVSEFYDFYAQVDPAEGYPMYADPAVDTPVPGESGQMWGSGWASTRQPIDMTSTYTIAVWIQGVAPPSAPSDLFLIGPQVSLGFGGTEHFILRAWSDGSISASAGNVTAYASADHFDGNPHLVVVTVSPSQLRIRTDLATDTATPMVTPSSSGYVWTRSSAFFFFNWIDFVAWGGENLTITPADWVDDTATIWANETATDRLDRFANAVGAPLPPVEDHTTSTLTSADLRSYGGTFADAITGIAESRIGTAWVTADGSLRVRDYNALTDDTYAADYQTRLAALTDVDFPGDAPVWDDPGLTWDDGDWVWWWPDLPTVRVDPEQAQFGRLDRVRNIVTLADANGVAFSAVDWGSRNRYGDRPLVIDTDLAGVGGLRTAPPAILARRSEPTVEIGAVHIDVWQFPEAAELVLAADLEMAVYYHESSNALVTLEVDGGSASFSIGSEEYDGGSATSTGIGLLDGGDSAPQRSMPVPLIEGNYQIQREEWSWQAGTHWTVTYTLARSN